MNPQEILNASLDDLVFERKNKAYGAYFLRKVYGKHIAIAMLIAVLTVFISLGVPILISLLTPKEVILAAKKPTSSVLSEPPPLEKLPPPPPVQNIPPPPKTVKFTPPVIKADEEVKPEDVPPTIEEVQTTEIATETSIDPNASVNFNDAPVEVEEVKPQIFMYVEQPPEFPGGEKALSDYLYKNLRYPAAARENSIEGKVVLQFVVNETGEITDIKPLRDIGGGCTEEAIRVVKGMPKWKPGKQNSMAVKVYFNLPVTFKLSE